MKKNQGFTLIELLVVIAVIGLLSTLAIIALGTAREKARDSKRLSDVRQIQTALELYYTDHNAYPTAAEPLVLGGANTSCVNTDGFGASGCNNAYMNRIPTDPEAPSQSYRYASADGTAYEILFELEGEVNNFSGTVKATPSGIGN